MTQQQPQRHRHVLLVLVASSMLVLLLARITVIRLPSQPHSPQSKQTTTTTSKKKKQPFIITEPKNIILQRALISRVLLAPPNSQPSVETNSKHQLTLTETPVEDRTQQQQNVTSMVWDSTAEIQVSLQQQNDEHQTTIKDELMMKDEMIVLQFHNDSNVRLSTATTPQQQQQEISDEVVAPPKNDTDLIAYLQDAGFDEPLTVKQHYVVEKLVESDVPREDIVQVLGSLTFGKGSNGGSRGGDGGAGFGRGGGGGRGGGRGRGVGTRNNNQATGSDSASQCVVVTPFIPFVILSTSMLFL